jgi:molybdate transport system substrate-binding protein
VHKTLSALGIADEVQDRMRIFPNGMTAMGKMAEQRGGQPIGCTQATEILHTPGLMLVGNLPAEHELATTYTAAVSARAASPDLARRLISLLTGEDVAATRRRLGFDQS